MMAIQTQKIEPHWNYLLALEHDLERLSRYVEFDSKNFECFSLEIPRVLLASAAEADVVCKQVCRKVDSKSSADNINEYRREITASFPAIPEFEVLIPRFGLALRPWDEWSKSNGVPFWWTAYNKIKHERDAEYQRANLKNALNAVAGLFIMVLYLYREKAKSGELVPALQLLQVSDNHFVGWNHTRYEDGTIYNI